MLLDVLHAASPRPFDELPAGASPFAFPIEVDDKPSVRRDLQAAGIDALDLWAIAHPAVPEDGFPRSARRRARTLALPVHQELRPRDLRRIARAAVAAVTGHGDRT
jgi:hypothetical protein